MTANKYLKQYGEAIKIVRRCQEQYIVESLQIDAIRSASDNDGMPHGNGKSDPTADKAVKLSMRAKRLIEAENEALELQQNIFDTVMLIGGLEADVLIERFIKLRKWTDVCDAVHYSWDAVRKAWHRGEDKLQAILDEKTTTSVM